MTAVHIGVRVVKVKVTDSSDVRPPTVVMGRREHLRPPRPTFIASLANRPTDQQVNLPNPIWSTEPLSLRASDSSPPIYLFFQSIIHPPSFICHLPSIICYLI